MTSGVPQLWTVWSESQGADEAPRLSARITYADDALAAQTDFSSRIADSAGTLVAGGVVRNPVTSTLFSERVLNTLEEADGAGMLESYAVLEIVTDRQNDYWTLSCDYAATGEGLSVMSMITPASTETEALADFTRRFGDYFVRGAEIQRGIIATRATDLLFSQRTISLLRTPPSGQTRQRLAALLHMNFS